MQHALRRRVTHSESLQVVNTYKNTLEVLYQESTAPYNNPFYPSGERDLHGILIFIVPTRAAMPRQSW